jgi:hypothetical protein
MPQRHRGVYLALDTWEHLRHAYVFDGAELPVCLPVFPGFPMLDKNELVRGIERLIGLPMCTAGLRKTHRPHSREGVCDGRNV